MKILQENYEWLFSGLGVAIILFIITRIYNSNLKENSNKNINSNTNSNENLTNNIVITNHLNSETETKLSSDQIKNLEDERLKEKTRILFVDDEHTKFKMVSILKKAGWKNTKSIKDIIDLDDLKAKEADFIFVDINGVGTSLFEDQGLGLASALKKKYPKKIIVLYSDETTGDRFHKALREVDDCLPKNAEPYQFINLIETLSE